MRIDPSIEATAVSKRAPQARLDAWPGLRIGTRRPMLTQQWVRALEFGQDAGTFFRVDPRATVVLAVDSLEHRATPARASHDFEGPLFIVVDSRVVLGGGASTSGEDEEVERHGRTE